MVVAAHPDDAEIGMGGTIAALIAAGKKVLVVDLTDGEPTPHGSPSIRKEESARASKILGITQRVTLDIPNREVYDTVENRRKVASLMREYRPRTLFIPYWEDAHPDHIQAFFLATAARFYSKFVKTDMPHDPFYPERVMHYFSTHYRVKFQPTFVFDISAHMQTKLDALRAYESQFVAHMGNSRIFEMLRTENGYWGQQAGCAFGEPFVKRDHILLRNVDSLLET